MAAPGFEGEQMVTSPRAEDAIMRVAEPFRESAVAGTFYPGNAEILTRTVGEYLDGERSVDDPGPAALICPHAGYDYSGPTAGRAYRELRDRPPEAVVILGPSHYDLFRGPTFWPGAGYRTPIGDVPQPRDLAEALVSAGVGVHPDVLGHRQEHSVEVQIPFLQTIAPGVPVLPLVLAEDRADRCRQIGEALAQAIGDRNVLLVASSDLYHGPSHDACVETDRRTLAAIERNDPDELADGFSSGRLQACGRGPILAVLEACRRRGATRARILARTNSNEVIGRRSGYVVGYGAVAVFAP
jgi:MEMO1 family protein